MSKGGRSGQQTVNTQVEPPAYAKPFLEYGLSEAKQRYETGEPNYYPFPTTVGFSPESELALSMTRDRALAGSPLVSNAQDYIGNIAQTGGGLGLGSNVFQRASTGGFQNEAMPMARNMLGGADFDEVLDYTRATARGDMIGNNPYLQGAIDRAIEPVKDKIQSQFALSGRYGSGANQGALADTLGEIASDITFRDYQRERQNQLQAQQQLGNLAQQQFRNQSGALCALANLSQADIQRQLAGANALSSMDRARMARQMEGAKLAPQFAELDYRDAQRLAQVGGAREADAMATLQSDIDRYNFEQNIDDQRLANYLSLIGGGTVGSNTIQPVFRNRGLSALGGALGGSQLAGLAGFNPMIGAIGGGLLGFS